MRKYNIYLVGGSIRDHILQIKSKDFDYMVEATYEEMKAFLQQKQYPIIFEKPECFSLKVKVPNKGVVDFTCCRTEGDYDGRTPNSVAITNVNGDLSRRDFTVNALAWEVDSDTFELIGQPIDPFDGIKDLADMKLRFVGSPYKRLEEDGLRWLRAIRFKITKGFLWDEELEEVMYNPPDSVLLKVSAERIREELYKCFKFNTYETTMLLAKLPNIWAIDNMWFKPTFEQ